MKLKYQQCVNCILDTKDDPEITFDENGVCNHCKIYIGNYVTNALPDQEKTKQLNQILGKIRKEGRGKKYDCILGISGGVDSSYLAYLAKEMGLRPLLVHFDNGWNTETAVRNIQGIVQKTGFDLFTYVVDWKEFKDIQLSYIKAGVLDWELITDHGFFACLHEQAHRFKLKYILTGHNYQTESILPNSMRWSKLDIANIKDIHKKFGKRKFKTFPMLGFFKYSWYIFIKGIKRLNILDYTEYNKEAAMEIIRRELDWKDYGGKHHESVFTRFYQSYVLMKKFGFDKRKAHLSNLILSGQITREEALIEMTKPTYDEQLLKQDFEYVAKKLGMTVEEFTRILAEPNRSHLDYKSYETGLYIKHIKFMKKISPFIKVVKVVLGK